VLDQDGNVALLVAKAHVFQLLQHVDELVLRLKRNELGAFGDGGVAGAFENRRGGDGLVN